MASSVCATSVEVLAQVVDQDNLIGANSLILDQIAGEEFPQLPLCIFMNKSLIALLSEHYRFPLVRVSSLSDIRSW
jgi:hypothetical protein